ncbi:MAG TPA: hypothetical protein PKA60_01185 [Candidatus Paceibacterota bacterium]|nr:hypothetical protein [Candidatus Paceibacterota bacterium]
MKNIILYHMASLFPRINKKKAALKVAEQELKKAANLTEEIVRTAKILSGLKFLGAYFRILDVTRKLESQEAQLREITTRCQLWVERARA